MVEKVTGYKGQWSPLSGGAIFKWGDILNWDLNNADHVNIWEGSFQTERTARAKATCGNLFPRWLQWVPSSLYIDAFLPPGSIMIPFSPGVWAGFGNSLELPQNETGVRFRNYWGQVIQSPAGSTWAHQIPLTGCSPSDPRHHALRSPETTWRCSIQQAWLSS